MIDWVICIIKGFNSQHIIVADTDDVFIEKITKGRRSVLCLRQLLVTFADFVFLMKTDKEFPGNSFGPIHFPGLCCSNWKSFGNNSCQWEIMTNTRSLGLKLGKKCETPTDGETRRF